MTDIGINEIQPLKTVHATNDNLGISISKLRTALEDSAPEEGSLEDTKNFSRALRRAIGDKQQSDKLIGHLAELHQYATQTNQAVAQAAKSSELKTRLAMQEKNAEANWELRNAYSVWAHRTIRWVLGAFMAVLFYSGVVWLQSKCDFIKIPVRDWITAAQPKA